MADLPRPPRSPAQPPPLPPRPIPTEPFANLVAEPAPDTLRTRRDEMPPPPELAHLLEEVAGLLEVHRQELIYSRERMPTIPATVPPESLRTRSRAAVAGLVASKYGGLFVLFGLVARLLAKQFPEFADQIEEALRVLGL